MQPSPHPARRRGIRLSLFVLAFFACAILLCSHFGGEDFVQTSLKALAQNEVFLRISLTLETGIFPPKESILPTAAVDTAIAEDEMSESSYIPTEMDTEENQSTETITSVSGGVVKINNNTNLSYNIPAMLQNPVKIHANTDGPQVFLIHTHSTEAYTQDAVNTYVSSEPSESERTLDKSKSIIRVGDEIAQVLQSRGISVIHCREVFDNPAYSGSYGRALTAIQKQLQQTPSIQVIIDVHRDSIVTDSGKTYKTSCTVNGESMAQLMLVMGSNASGLSHDHWRENLNYAVNLQSRLTGTYPDLMRPINLRAQRFNEHLRVGSLLLEVGSSGNTLPEAISAAKLFANVLADDLLDA